MSLPAFVQPFFGSWCLGEACFLCHRFLARCVSVYFSDYLCMVIFQSYYHIQDKGTMATLQPAFPFLTTGNPLLRFPVFSILVFQVHYSRCLSAHTLLTSCYDPHTVDLSSNPDLNPSIQLTPLTHPHFLMVLNKAHFHLGSLCLYPCLCVLNVSRLSLSFSALSAWKSTADALSVLVSLRAAQYINQCPLNSFKYTDFCSFLSVFQQCVTQSTQQGIC